MIKHVVMWKVRGFSQTDEVLKKLKNPEEAIPGLISFDNSTDTIKSSAASEVSLISSHEYRNAQIRNYEYFQYDFIKADGRMRDVADNANR